jgi:hypothetical protein
MPTIKTLKKENRQANINLVNESFEVEFLENGNLCGVVEYYDKSFPYVDDAAENWICGILTLSTLENYRKELTL